MLGIGKIAAVPLLALTFIMVVNLLQVWFLFLIIPLFVVLVRLSKDDPFFFDILIQKIKLKEVFD